MFILVRPVFLPNIYGKVISLRPALGRIMEILGMIHKLYLYGNTGNINVRISLLTITCM